MAYAPTITLASDSVKGVKFTVQRIGFGRRTELDLKTLTLRQHLRELEMQSPPPSPKEMELQQQLETAKKKAMLVPEEELETVIQKDVLPIATDLSAAASLDVRTKRKLIDEEYITVHRQIRAIWVTEALVSIEGGNLDGMTAEQLLDYGPPELAEEIGSALFGSGKLTGEQAKNLPSPTISAGAEKATPITIASDAKSADSTGSETVSAISPAS